MQHIDILIVDDELGIRDLIAEILQDEGYRIRTACNAEEARAIRCEQRPDLVLLDIWMPDCDGITLLKEWANHHLLNMPVIMMSGHASLDLAVESTKIGAMGFLEKPIALKKLLETVENALKYSKIQEKSYLSLDKLGHGKAIQNLKNQLKNICLHEHPLLLVGEAGSPFEQVASFFRSPNRPWIMPSPEQWLSHAQDWNRLAHTGILYLGNVAEYSLAVQAEIVNTLKNRNNSMVRVIAACSRPLNDFNTCPQELDPRLGEELSGHTLTIPALRDYQEDIPWLVNQILVQLVESRQAPLVSLNKDAMDAMQQYHWLGNFDQLCRVVKNLALSAKKGVVDLSMVEYVLDQYRSVNNCTGGFNFDLPLRELRESIERSYFEYHIRRENGNMSIVAQKVGLERTHLYRKLKQLGVAYSRRHHNKNSEEAEES